jgi:hypothetical protein
MTPAAADTLLKWVLRAVGGIELLAVPFVFFPVPWMDHVHRRLLGLGPLPDGPIVEYMARSLSALYAVHGAVVFALSFDLPRYRPLIRLVGVLHLLLGAAVLGIDLSAGMPTPWVLGEGPGIAAGGAAVLLLNRAADRPPPHPTGSSDP